ncbi:MAG TPA: metallopeptidase TldD-related protein [Bryobacteraceae bacterium]
MSQSSDLLSIATEAVGKALARGASGAECTLSEGDEFSANVRMSEVETLKEAGSRAAGIRILMGKRVGSSYTSDLTRDGIAKMLEAAFEIAEITTEDPFAGLPDPADLGKIEGDLQLYSGDIAVLSTPEKIELARRAENAALTFDPRITNSKGASFDTFEGRHVFANSLGFSGEYRSSYCSISVMPVAKAGQSMERDYWHSASRRFAGLDQPEEVGRIAAERVIRRLGGKKVPTQKVPVIFEPRTARSILGHLFEAVDGRSIYRSASFLAGKIGQKIATENVNVVDDGTIPGLMGTSPFDDEGVPSRRTVVIENGVLRNYLLNSYTARKLGMHTTGNASRGVTGNAGISTGNFYLEKGARNPADMIRDVKEGFFVTELIGQGVNIVTGDYSRGAAGIWIHDGELTYPVSEVTIASTLQEMLAGIVEIGNDLRFRGSMESPTLMMREMTVGGR